MFKNIKRPFVNIGKNFGKMEDRLGLGAMIYQSVTNRSWGSELME